MPKPNQIINLATEPDYNIADIEHDDAVQASYDEAADPDYEAGIDPEYDDAAQVDYAAELVDPEYDEVAEVTAPTEPEPLIIVAAEAAFAFELGRPVLPLSQQQPQLVVWRGHLKERHPATGLLRRVPVYRLADGYWDCYREEELQAA